jgi:2-isopropylmalate synthase
MENADDRRMATRKIEIFDTTLREGTQTPEVSFSFQQKADLLSELFNCGVEFAEVGYPAASNAELDEISRLTALTERPMLSVLSRCSVEDVLHSSKASAEVLDIDLGISRYQLEYLRLTIDEAFDLASQVLAVARQTGKRIKFACVDSFRTPLEDLGKLYQHVSCHGIEWFTLCDTVGVANPESVSSMVRKLKAFNGCKLSVHFHNDFGMAVANSVIAAVNGAEQLEVTVNGLGDRAGIASMIPVLTYLREICGFRVSTDSRRLRELSRKVSEMTGISISPLEPIVGEYCFKHVPGIHVAGIIREPATFEPISPETVGQERSITLGRYTGRKAVAWSLQKLGASASDSELEALTKLVKQLSYEGRTVAESELIMLLQRVRTSEPGAQNGLNVAPD